MPIAGIYNAWEAYKVQEEIEETILSRAARNLFLLYGEICILEYLLIYIWNISLVNYQTVPTNLFRVTAFTGKLKTNAKSRDTDYRLIPEENLEQQKFRAAYASAVDQHLWCSLP